MQQAADADRRGSAWSVVALVSAVVAGVLGVARDRRPVWRVVAGLSATLTVVLAVVVGLLIWFLSAGGPTT
jgi:ABC-type tungstate transport system substrate-binding protein